MQITRKTIILLYVMLAIPALFFANKSFANGSRGIKTVSVNDPTGEKIELYKESHALIIGAGNYTSGWPKLPGVEEDVKAVHAALEEQGFSVDIVRDPNSVQLSRAFNDFIRRYGRNESSRLLFYFAGHGYTATLAYGGEMGYIVPIDAPNPDIDLDGFKDKAVDMQQVEVYAKRIESKHVLFMFDSCFSGSIFSLRRAIPKSITYKTARPVRQFITSGSANEQVPDESIFRRQFVLALKGEGDLNNDGYVTGDELGMFLENQVTNYSKGSQHPQSGKIRDPNLDKGDFIFILIKGDVNIGAGKSAEKDKAAKPSIDFEAELLKMKKEIDELKREKKKIEVSEVSEEEQKRIDAEIKRKEEKIKVQEKLEAERQWKITEAEQWKDAGKAKGKWGVSLGFRGLGSDEKKYFDDFSKIDKADEFSGAMVVLGASWIKKPNEFRLQFASATKNNNTDVNTTNNLELSYSTLGIDWLYHHPGLVITDSLNGYIGGGIFIPFVNVTGDDYTGSAEGTGWRAITGIKFKLVSHLELELQLDYHQTNIDEIEIEGAGTVEPVTLSSASLSLLITVRF